MQLIKKMIHPELASCDGRVLRRYEARGIVLRGGHILLLYTERYNDYSLPDGGVDAGEDTEVALKRELLEETGARAVKVIENLGYIEEYRPHWKAHYDLVHMTSRFFLCEIADQLAAANMEDYEVANGMRPEWVPVHTALAHNREVFARQEKIMGQSIQRETFMLDKIAREWLGSPAEAAR